MTPLMSILFAVKFNPLFATILPELKLPELTSISAKPFKATSPPTVIPDVRLKSALAPLSFVKALVILSVPPVTFKTPVFSIELAVKVPSLKLKT